VWAVYTTHGDETTLLHLIVLIDVSSIGTTEDGRVTLLLHHSSTAASIVSEVTAQRFSEPVVVAGSAVAGSARRQQAKEAVVLQPDLSRSKHHSTILHMMS
jgi:hypothetical protein